MIVDTVRVLVALAGFALVGASMRGWSEMTSTRRLRRAGVAVVFALIAARRLENLGETILWELPVAALAVALVGWAEIRRVRRPADGRQ